MSHVMCVLSVFVEFVSNFVSVVVGGCSAVAVFSVTVTSSGAIACLCVN